MIDSYAAKVIMDMWAWFIVPFGLITLSFWHALGLYFFCALLSKTDTKELSDEEKQVFIITKILKISIIWVFGWFFYYMMVL